MKRFPQTPSSMRRRPVAAATADHDLDRNWPVDFRVCRGAIAALGSCRDAALYLPRPHSAHLEPDGLVLARHLGAYLGNDGSNI